MATPSRCRLRPLRSSHTKFHRAEVIGWPCGGRCRGSSIDSVFGKPVPRHRHYGRHHPLAMGPGHPNATSLAMLLNPSRPPLPALPLAPLRYARLFFFSASWSLLRLDRRSSSALLRLPSSLRLRFDHFFWAGSGSAAQTWRDEVAASGVTAAAGTGVSPMSRGGGAEGYATRCTVQNRSASSR